MDFRVSGYQPAYVKEAADMMRAAFPGERVWVWRRRPEDGGDWYWRIALQTTRTNDEISPAFDRLLEQVPPEPDGAMALVLTVDFLRRNHADDG